jgi:hypothetical protein
LPPLGGALGASVEPAAGVKEKESKRVGAERAGRALFVSPGDHVTAPDPRDPHGGNRLDAIYIGASALAGPASRTHRVTVHLVEYEDGTKCFWPRALLAVLPG